MPINISSFKAARSGRSTGGGGSTGSSIKFGSSEGPDPLIAAQQYDVTAQYPSSAASESLESNMKSAQQKVALLTSLGLQIPDEISQTAQQGYVTPRSTLFEKVLAVLDNPRRTVNMAIQDIAGGKAKPGYDDPNFKDYLTTLFTTDKAETVKARTGLDPVSGGATLGMFGWDEADTLGGKIVRGAGDFFLSVLTDPLTYVTFGASALGKKVLAKEGAALVRGAEEALTHYAASGTLHGLSQTNKFAAGTSAAKRLTSLVDDTAVKYVDELLIDEVGERAAMTMARQQAVPEVTRVLTNDIMVPLVSKDFGAKELAPYIDVLPAYATGGARLSIPFLGRKSLASGLTIPGTRGAGRQVKVAVSHLPGIRKMADNASNAGFKRWGSVLSAIKKDMDYQGWLLGAVKDGSIDGWQYLKTVDALEAHLLNTPLQVWTAGLNASQTKIDNMYKLLDLGDLGDYTSSQIAKQDIYGIVTASQYAPKGQEAETLWAAFTGWIEKRNPSHQLQEEVVGFVSNWNGAAQRTIMRFNQVNPGLVKEMEGYIPSAFQPGARKWLNEIAGSAAAAVDPSLVNQDYGAYILSQVLHAVGGGSQVDAALGQSVHFEARQLGKHPIVHFAPKGEILFMDPRKIAAEAGNIASKELGEAARQGADAFAALIEDINPNVFVGSVQLNDAIEGLVTKLADDLGVALPEGGARLFDEDPFRLAHAYVRDMERTFREQVMINNLQAAGLVINHKTELSVSDALGELANRLKADPKMKKKIDKAFDNAFKSPINSPGQVKKVADKFRRSVGWATEIKHLDKRPVSDSAEDLLAWSHNKEYFPDKLRREYGGIDYSPFGDGPERNVRVMDGITYEPIQGSGAGIDAVGGEMDGFDVLQQGNHGAVLNLETGTFAQTPMSVNRHAEAERAIWVHDGNPLESYDPYEFGAKYEAGGAIQITYDNRAVRPPEQTLKMLENEDNFIARPSATAAQREARGDAIMSVYGNIEGLSENAKAALRTRMQNLAALTGHTGGIRFYVFDDVNGTGISKIVPTVKYSAKNDNVLVDSVVKAIRGIYLNAAEEGTPAAAQRAEQLVGYADAYGSDMVAKVVGATEEMIDIQVKANEMYQVVAQLTDKGALHPTDLLSENVFGGLRVGPTYRSDPADPFFKMLERTVEVGQDLGLKLGPVSESGRATAAKSAKQALRGSQGIIAKSAREVAEVPGFVDPHLFKVGGDILDKKLVQKDIGRFFQTWVQNEASIYTPLGMANLKEGTSQVIKWWKGMATVSRPTFHIRNTTSGVWMNQSIGVRARDYLEVNTGMAQLRNALDSGKSMREALSSISNPTRQAKFRALFDSGLLDVSFSRSSFSKMTAEERTKLASAIQFINPLSPEFGLIRGGSRIMETTEDFLRAAAFFAWLDPKDIKGTQMVAKEMALAVHFDYQHLTQWETQIKKFVPFFVWARRNIPLQIQMMVEQPGMVNRYSHLMQAGSDQFAAVEQDKFPVSDYWHAQAVGTDIVMNADTPFWARIMIDPDLPITDLLELGSLTDIGSAMQSLIGPQFTAPIDFLQQQEFGDVNAPQPLGAVLRQLGNIGFFDVPADGNSVEIPYAMRTLYNTIFPFARETIESPIGPTDPNQAAQLGGPESTLAERLGLTLAKGVGVKVQTPAMTKSVDYRTDKTINDILGDLRENGQIGQTEEELFQERWRKLSSEQREVVWRSLSGR
jgi:hypothetical protein